MMNRAHLRRVVIKRKTRARETRRCFTRTSATLVCVCGEGLFQLCLLVCFLCLNVALVLKLNPTGQTNTKRRTTSFSPASVRPRNNGQGPATVGEQLNSIGPNKSRPGVAFCCWPAADDAISFRVTYKNTLLTYYFPTVLDNVVMVSSFIASSLQNVWTYAADLSSL